MSSPKIQTMLGRLSAAWSITATGKLKRNENSFFIWTNLNSQWRTISGSSPCRQDTITEHMDRESYEPLHELASDALPREEGDSHLREAEKVSACKAIDPMSLSKPWWIFN